MQKKARANTRNAMRVHRHRRVRAKVRGGKLRPRLCVYRSNTAIYAQIIDDEKGTTLFFATDKTIPAENRKGKTKLTRAAQVGEYLATIASKAGLKKVRFDRGGYRYHGRVKALADGARKGGLIF